MPQSADKELKAFFKTCYKSDKKSIFILVREIRKNLLELKIKDEGKTGNKTIRVHTDDEKSPIWFIHGYTIPMQNLGYDIVSDKSDIVKILNIVTGIPDAETKTLLKKIIKVYGEILDDQTRNKYTYRTERFKKKKDYFRVKRKAM